MLPHVAGFHVHWSHEYRVRAGVQVVLNFSTDPITVQRNAKPRSLSDAVDDHIATRARTAEGTNTEQKQHNAKKQVHAEIHKEMDKQLH